MNDALTCNFIMLKLSPADAEVNDPTIRRCIRFANSLRCTTLVVVDLYRYRPRMSCTQSTIQKDRRTLSTYEARQRTRACNCRLGHPLTTGQSRENSYDAWRRRLYCLGTNKTGAFAAPSTWSRRCNQSMAASAT